MYKRHYHLPVCLVIALYLLAIASPLILFMVKPVQAQSGSIPILVLVDDEGSQRFGRYIGEILRAEGLNSFEIKSISDLGSTQLATELNNHDLTILAQIDLSSTQASTVQTYYDEGGRLIAMRPDSDIRSLFGLGTSGGTALVDPYVAIDSNAIFSGATPGSGLPDDTLQIHGSADRFSLTGGAVALAQLYFDASQSSSFAAVVGTSNGRAVAYNYDLPQNIAYTRQGNPANANVDTDGDTVLRTVDLFQAQGGGAPWVDRTKIPLPQADIQQRFFARLVRQLVNQVRPMPQLWYFPGQEKTTMVLTGDAHANPTTYYQDEINSINLYGGKITLYISISGEPTDATIQAWRGQGHEFGIHPPAFKPDSYPPYNVTNLAQGYQVNDDWYNNTFSSAPSRTVRNHQVAWLGWTDGAALQASHGYEMDTNFYHWGQWLKIPGGAWPHGYITGSGQPMKFVESDGTILPVYQQLTQLVDEQLTAGENYEALNAAQAIQVSQQLINASQAGDYAALMTQFHVDYWGNGTAKDWAEGTMAYAQSLNIPIINADKWLDFTKSRHDAEFTNITWNTSQNSLTFNMVAATNNQQTLSVLLPLSYTPSGSSARYFANVLVDGVTKAAPTITVSGKDFALVTVPAGNHGFQVNYSTVAPTPTNTPVATATPTYTATPVSTPTPTATTAGATPTPTPLPSSIWTHVPGQCAPSLEGAVFSTVGTGCGGTATTFDVTEVYGPAILRDIATTQAPCVGIATGAICYRMWYAGETNESAPMTGYAVSQDGVVWTRVAGSGIGGSVFGAGAPGGFDSTGTSYVSALKDGSTYKIWYVGYGASGYVEGIGHATSTDGINWQRVPGPLAGGAVMLPTHQNGIFDRDTVNTPYVIKDLASTTMPCAGVATGETCYRMWYEGANTESSYRFKIGYATSPDGLTWTRVWDPTSSDHSVLNIAEFGNFDDNSVGVPAVIKEGATLHMWYEAKNYAAAFAIGHATSTDGIHWTRSMPNTAIWTGANDPGTFTPDNVWTPLVLKESAQYRMWYSVSTQPQAQRIGLAKTTPGSELSNLNVTGDGTSVTVSFSTNIALPANSSVLLTLPANVQLIGASGFGLIGFGSSGTIAMDPAAITDAASQGVARAALVILLPDGTQAGSKTVTFQLPTPLFEAGQLLVQTFAPNNVAEFGVAQLPFSGTGPTATPTNTPVPLTATPTNTPVPPTVTPTNTPNGGSVIHTTVNDFAESCVVADGVAVNGVGGGSVQLAGQLHDGFSTTALDTGLWNAGSWSGGSFSPTFAGDSMTLPADGGGWVRSNALFTHGSVEAVATFGSGAWQHLGFGPDAFDGNRYLLFSTASGGDRLYARANNNGSEQNVDLGAIPTGEHRYRIDWLTLNATTDQVTFWLDGAQVAQMNLASAGATNYYLYLSNNGNTALSVTDIDVAPAYLTSGSFTSCVLDAGSGHAWQTAAWNATAPADTGMTVQVRTSLDNVTWDNWSTVSTAAGSTFPTLGRYAQYQLSFTTSNTAVSAQLNSITLTHGAAVLPTPTNTPVPPTATNTPEHTATPTNTAIPPTVTNTPVPPTPTNTPTPSGGSVTHSNVNDFAESCVAMSGTNVSAVAGGRVLLAGALHDGFSTAALDTGLWSAGSWSGGSFSPTFAGDSMTLPADGGGWVRSNALFTHGSVEAVATFGSGAWQHIGFGSDGFGGNRYLLFSTASGTGKLYARVNNNGGEQYVDVGAIPTGEHRYRIDWLTLNATTDQVTFWLDGAQVAQMNLASAGATNYYLYLSNNGNTALSVADIDVAPAYLTSGSFTSCVLDAGSGHAWQTAAWNATAPADTGMTVQVRTSLDNVTWDNWSTVSTAAGSTFPTLGRYAQYQLSFTTSNTAVSAQLNSITLTHGAAVLPTPTNTPIVTPTNTPVPPTETPTNTPMPPAESITQSTTGDFAQSCVAMSGTNVSAVAGGRVLLAGALHDGFSTTSLNTGLWSAGSWSGGSFSPTFAGDSMTLPADGGGWVRSNALFTHGSVEAVATFGSGAWQHIGFGSDGFGGNRYLLFSTASGTGRLYARVNNNTSEQNVDVGAIPTGEHRYRIDWLTLNATTDQVTFWLDGAQVAQMNLASAGATNYYLYLSNNGNTALSVADIDVAPAYLTSGSFTSCVLDAGSGHAWQTAAWNATAPADTGMTVQVRTSLDNVTWDNWSTVSTAAGSTFPTLGRYAQYQLSFTTSNTAVSAQLNSITLTHGAAVLPTPTNTPVPPTATNTPEHTATPTNTAIPPTVTNTPLPPTETPTNTPLPPTETPINTPVPPTATNTPEPTATPINTPAPSNGSVTHSNVNDFAESCVVADGVVVNGVGGGSLQLAGQLHDGFSTAALDTGLWNAGSWSGGSFSPTFAGDSMTLPADGGGWVRSNALFTHGSVEAVATFGSGAWQHIGFGTDGFESNRYLLFSTASGTGNLYARANNNGTEQQVNLGAIPTGEHRYRIDWLVLDAATDQVTFWLDGAQVAQMNLASAGATNYYLYLSNNGNTALSVADIDVAPAYLTSGSFTSCVLDAGSGHAWQTAAWDATAPANTGLTVQVRTSADNVTWDAWSTLSTPAGGSIPTPGRYAQYLLTFTTSDPANSAQLTSLTLNSDLVGASANIKQVQSGEQSKWQVWIPIANRE